MEKAVLRHFIIEDCPAGDITSRAIFGPRGPRTKAAFLAKTDLILSGLFAVKEILKTSFPGLALKSGLPDGSAVADRTVFATLTGPVTEVLRAERLCLNILQRLSGIATLTRAFADRAQPFRVTILDTRKTTPGLREWEKRAVVHGGGANHRLNLSDQYLIKDNHIAAAGSVSAALTRVIADQKRFKQKPKIEVEVTDLNMLREALAFRPDIVLLDNMSPALIRRAVAIRNESAPRVLLEISGGVTLKTLNKFLPLGVERISVGALTHSAPAADISLEINL